MSNRSPEVEARRALAIMMALTVVVIVFVLVVDLSTTARSVILVAWMAVMMAVLRQTQ